MKSAKKILALILAGVMALALLTGCGKATSLNRTIAEGLAEHTKLLLAQEENKNNISVSYQVPELSRDIAPLFDENWITKGRNGDILNSKHMVNDKSVEDTLTDILSPYISATSALTFLAADVTDVKTPFMEALNLTKSRITFDNNIQSIDLASVTSLKIAVTHKTVNGRTYVPLCIHYGGVNLSPCPGALRPGAFLHSGPNKKASPAAFPAIARPGPAGDALVLQKMRLTSALRRGLRW